MRDITLCSGSRTRTLLMCYKSRLGYDYSYILLKMASTLRFLKLPISAILNLNQLFLDPNFSLEKHGDEPDAS